jgi:hypothetical protein
VLDELRHPRQSRPVPAALAAGALRRHDHRNDAQRRRRGSLRSRDGHALPNLSAAVADIAHPSWRASAIGIYRFWRDLGYGIGALGLGAAAALGGGLESVFWFVSIAMAFSGAVLYRWGEDTHPRLNPAH